MISRAFLSLVISTRESYRKAGDYGRADIIRDVLRKYGIMLEDTKDGTEWRLC